MDISEEDIIMTTQVSNLSEHDHNDQQKCRVHWMSSCVREQKHNGDKQHIAVL